MEAYCGGRLQSNADYAGLKRRVTAAGLLEKRPLRHYGLRGLALAAMLAASFAVMALADSLAVHLANAAFMAFTLVQLCFLGHDFGHQQVCGKPLHNDVGGLVVSALVGINRSWWVDKHNRHHAAPNHVDLDPDVNFPFLAFSEDCARRKGLLARAVVRRQAYLFYPMLCLEGASLKVSGMGRLIAGCLGRGPRLRFPAGEPAAMAVHLAVHGGAPFLLMPPLDAVLFILVSQALMGLYIGATFAPNHKGMEMHSGGLGPGFLRRQVAASRNVRPGVVNDYLYGGLNYQIEHHLFPSMPRNNLRKAREIVRPYCMALAVEYHETGIVRSHREIVRHLHGVGRSLAVIDRVNAPGPGRSPGTA